MKTLVKLLIGGTAGVLLGSVFFGATTLSEIERLQNEYFQKHGTYLQVIPDNKLPTDRKGSVKSLLGKDLPAGYRINVYGNKKGQGYEVQWEDANGFYSKGYGPEAEERTWTVLKNATST